MTANIMIAMKPKSIRHSVVKLRYLTQCTLRFNYLNRHQERKNVSLVTLSLQISTDLYGRRGAARDL